MLSWQRPWPGLTPLELAFRVVACKHTLPLDALFARRAAELTAEKPAAAPMAQAPSSSDCVSYDVLSDDDSLGATNPEPLSTELHWSAVPSLAAGCVSSDNLSADKRAKMVARVQGGLRSIAEACFSYDPRARPDAAELVKRLELLRRQWAAVSTACTPMLITSARHEG